MQPATKMGVFFHALDGSSNKIWARFGTSTVRSVPSKTMCFLSYMHDRRKFRSQTSDNMDRWKAELGRGREKRRVEERRSEKRKSQKKADADARKGRKVAKHCVFPMIWGSGGSKSRLAKAAGAEPAGQMRDEKLHAVVARSTFRSQNVQNTSASPHFWKLRCQKSARRSGAKHISKSICTKHTILGPLLEVEISKKCTPLWREAHFEVKMHKTHHSRTTFGGSDVASRGRRKGLCTLSKVRKTWGFCNVSTTTDNHHYTTLHSNTLHHTTNTTTTTPSLHSTTLHYTTLHCTLLHCTALHYTTLHSTTLTTTTTTTTATTTTILHLHYAALHYTNYTTLRYTPLHYAE